MQPAFQFRSLGGLDRRGRRSRGRQHGLLQTHHRGPLDAKNRPQADIGLAVDSSSQIPRPLLAEQLGVNEITLSLLEQQGGVGVRRWSGGNRRLLRCCKPLWESALRRGMQNTRLTAEKADQCPSQAGSGAAGRLR